MRFTPNIFRWIFQPGPPCRWQRCRAGRASRSKSLRTTEADGRMRPMARLRRVLWLHGTADSRKPRIVKAEAQANKENPVGILFVGRTIRVFLNPSYLGGRPVS